MLGDIFNVLWTITKWMAMICIWCVIMRFVLHRFLKVITRMLKWFILPLVKDINKIKKAYGRTNVKTKPVPVDQNKVKVEAEIILD